MIAQILQAFVHGINIIVFRIVKQSQILNFQAAKVSP